jgi:hypothetical protein
METLSQSAACSRQSSDGVESRGSTCLDTRPATFQERRGPLGCAAPDALPLSSVLDGSRSIITQAARALRRSREIQPPAVGGSRSERPWKPAVPRKLPAVTAGVPAVEPCRPADASERTLPLNAAQRQIMSTSKNMASVSSARPSGPSSAGQCSSPRRSHCRSDRRASRSCSRCSASSRWRVGRVVVTQPDSAFPCDVAYSASPTASRASARVGYMSIRIARPSRTVQTIAYRWSTSIPLVLPRPEW